MNQAETMSLPSGKEFKKAREERGVSRLELAEKAKVRFSTIADFESGRRDTRIGTIKKLMDALQEFPPLRPL